MLALFIALLQYYMMCMLSVCFISTQFQCIYMRTENGCILSYLDIIRSEKKLHLAISHSALVRVSYFSVADGNNTLRVGT